MSARTFLGPVRSLFATVSAAASVAGAVEANRKPRRSDLTRLGIDADAFGRIGKF